MLLSASDFGRSDHAWAGNYFLVGGGLRGERIHVHYPNDLTADGPLNVGRGRLPTTPWEGVWRPLAQWFGVDEPDALRRVLPNLGLFDAEHMIELDAMFSRPLSEVAMRTPRTRDVLHA